MKDEPQRRFQASHRRFAEWSAWHWAHGRTQREIGEHLPTPSRKRKSGSKPEISSLNAAAVCLLINAWMREQYPGKHIYNRLEAAREHFAGVAEPPLPEGAKPFSGVQPDVAPLIGPRAIAAAEQWLADELAGRVPKRARHHYAERFGIGGTTVDYARNVLLHAPDLAPKVKAGELSAYEAAMQVFRRRPRDEYGRRLDRLWAYR